MCEEDGCQRAYCGRSQPKDLEDYLKRKKHGVCGVCGNGFGSRASWK
ncbi:hypothetical protein T4A_5058 [Trichinella pseudospiralis]|nr:hypothetical protein T4A_5058 [Trichinella pseudospiralis]